MPNWCSNHLTVTGPKRSLKSFKDKAEGYGPGGKSKEMQTPLPLSFHALYPQPEFKENDEGWYDWRCNHWGTKWELSHDTLFTENPKSLTYTFETAWAPPLEWLAKVAPKFKALSFELWYAEGGVDFGGIATYEKGEFVGTEELSYRQAMLRKYGEIQECCHYCDGEFTTTTEDVSPLEQTTCPQCLDNHCAHCETDLAGHADGKCPFDTTNFKSLREEHEEKSLGRAQGM